MNEMQLRKVTRLALADRGGVLFVGIAVGAVMALSFLTYGKPVQALIPAETAKAPAITLPAAAPANAHDLQCSADFPLSPRVLTGLRSNRPLRIGVIGDSFGEGIYAATNGQFQESDGFQVYSFAKEGIGLTRYQSLDVLAHVKSRFAQTPIDIAIIDFGANDTQGVRQGGHGAAYMTPRWQAVVGGRAAELVTYLRQQGVAVAWVGLPRMRKPDFDRDVQAMNAFYTGLMCKLGVPFVNPVAASEDHQHRFAMELIDSSTKQPYIARAEDGVHMSFHGYREITKPVLQRIALLSKNAPDDQR